MQSLPWNELQDFLAVAHAGTLVRAAALTGVDATTIGRRLRRLEQRMGTVLLERARTGQALTEAGEQLLARTEAMQAIADTIADKRAPSGGLTGLVRISASEGFGTWFLAARIPELAKLHPELMIDLAATSGFLSPSKRETDIAVLLARPKSGPVIASKLSDYSLRLYAARTYLELRKKPNSVGQLIEHEFVGYIPDLIYAPELRYLDEFDPPPIPRVRSSSINAQHRLIAGGAGIGVLPCFIGDADPFLVPVLPNTRMIRSFWVVTHQDTHQLGKVRAVKNWLADLISRYGHVILPD